MKTILSISALFKAGKHTDKVAHALTGIIIYLICFVGKWAVLVVGYNLTFIDPITSLIPVYVAAIGKEIYDSMVDGHTSDVWDAVATVAIPTVLGLALYNW